MDGVDRVAVLRTSALSRMVWGAAMVIAPRPVLRTLAGRPGDLPETVLRLLGCRHLLQATATLLRPSRPILTVGAAFDGLHAGTALALAAVNRPQRRVALVDAAIAATWIALDLRAAAARGRRRRLAAAPWWRE